MKNFRKNKEGFFICEECGKEFKRLCGLSKHINVFHNHKKYYDKWLLNNNESKCQICGNSNTYTGAWHKYRGYNKYCSEKCRKIGRVKNIKKTCLIKYGESSPFKLDFVKEKKKETYLKNFGVDHNMKSYKGLMNNFKSRRLIKQFRDTNLTYQGSYELDFLEKFYNKIDIENGPSIPYLFEGKSKVYHSDFYIPSKNLVVEIKSDYILSLDTEIKEKKKATISNGFNYILILNKNYKVLKN